MRYSKYSAMASLVFIFIPFISAVITNFIPLLFSHKISFKVIMGLLFICAWLFLTWMVTSLPEEILQKIKLLRASTYEMQRYWYAKYNSNSYISCSLIKICDDCERKTKSIAIDYNLDLTEKKTLGIDDWKFDGDEKLRVIYLSGNERHSFIRATYKAGDYDLVRIDDTGTDIVKVTGELICVSVDMLRCSGICEDEKIAAKMLKKFKLTQQNIKQLIEYMHRMDDSDFAKEVLRKHNVVKIQQLSSSQFHPTAPSNPVDENFGTSFGAEKLSKKGK